MVLVLQDDRACLTRGMKGCYVYAVDKELNEYLKSFMNYETTS